MRLHCLCGSKSLSEEGLREIIERHGLTPNNHKSTPRSKRYYDFFRSACYNARVTEGIIQYLLDYFPDAANAADECGWSPLHNACNNRSTTFNIIQLLIDAAPDSVRSVTNKGNMPLHILCANKTVNEGTAIQILRLLIEKCPESVRHTNNNGRLPIHIASWWRSPEFCRLLIDAYPGSAEITDGNGNLPLHYACFKNTLPTVEYLFRLHPDGIHHANTNDDGGRDIHATANGRYPIHAAINSVVVKRVDPIAAVKTVEFLLDCDPNVKLQKYRGHSLLRFACDQHSLHPNIDAALEIVKLLYDAHPEAIEDTNILVGLFHQQVRAFISRELVYARQAKNLRLMMTPDGNGQLPLHKALQNNVTLGSIKLLVKGNHSAIRHSDNSGMIPLHIACQHHDSASVIQCLLDLEMGTLNAADSDNNTALHYACRGAKHETIALLLEKHDALSVSKRNAQDKLPIELLWESDAVDDRDIIEYTGSTFRLLKAYPEVIMSGCMNAKQQATSGGGPSQNGSGWKRKYSNVNV